MPFCRFYVAVEKLGVEALWRSSRASVPTKFANISSKEAQRKKRTQQSPKIKFWGFVVSARQDQKRAKNKQNDNIKCYMVAIFWILSRALVHFTLDKMYAPL